MVLVSVLVCSTVICNSAFVADLNLRGIITSIRFCCSIYLHFDIYDLNNIWQLLGLVDLHRKPKQRRRGCTWRGSGSRGFWLKSSNSLIIPFWECMCVICVLYGPSCSVYVCVCVFYCYVVCYPCACEWHTGMFAKFLCKTHDVADSCGRDTNPCLKTHLRQLFVDWGIQQCRLHPGQQLRQVMPSTSQFMASGAPSTSQFMLSGAPVEASWCTEGTVVLQGHLQWLTSTRPVSWYKIGITSFHLLQ